MLTLDEILAAERIVRAALPPTPAIGWPLLERCLGAHVIVKHENHNPTGAFKVRGGLTFVDALKRRKPDVKGMIAATRGNHGQSLAFAGARAGLDVTIYAPRGNSVEKNAAMRAYGAHLVEAGADFQESLEIAMSAAGTLGLEPVPSFHRDLVSGVSTYSLELFREHPDLDVLYVPIGLGSGISGAIAARDALELNTEIVGVQAKGAPSYARSLAAGHPVSTNVAETLADGMATRSADAEAFAIIAKGVADIVLVSDDEIGEAVRIYWSATHNLAEGSGAAPLAAALKERDRLRGRKVGLVLSGGNIDFALFQSWVARSGARSPNI